MSADLYAGIEKAAAGGQADAAFELLERKFLEDGNYPMLFELRLMKTRQRLGLPLIQTEAFAELPEDKRRAYDEGCIAAARETGSLFLARGDILRAWPYFRAIGENAPVAEAIEKAEAGDGIESVIEIAFQERVNPRRGFELILQQFGICRAITLFDAYPVAAGREECLRLLARTLHRELIENLKRVVAQREGSAPETGRIPELIAGRDWLFGEYDYYVDTSHLASILRFALDAKDVETLRLALEFTEYGKRLSTQFSFRGEPPFEDTYADHAMYLRAVLGEGAAEAVAHFRRKAEAAEEGDTIAAQVLVGLLVRLGRYGDAIEVSRAHLGQCDASQLGCPPVVQLCQQAGDFDQLERIAREKGDLLSFAAAALQRQRKGVA
ncbi:MAG: hypothetical protein ACRD8O_06200 [Bryobacteraceae bacterium]